MSQRNSGYDRMPRDEYSTPEWVTKALIPHIPMRVANVWEPAAGNGKLSSVLEADQYSVFSSDIAGKPPVDFLREDCWGEFDAIITNPPYEHAREFIERSLRFMSDRGAVAMLLRTDFDHAKTRQHLFAQCSAFAKKVVLTKRIQWFEDSKGSPSFNHAWFIWDWRHRGPPTLAYGP